MRCPKSISSSIEQLHHKKRILEHKFLARSHLCKLARRIKNPTALGFAEPWECQLRKFDLRLSPFTLDILTGLKPR
jgi:hypothetical protein